MQLLWKLNGIQCIVDMYVCTCSVDMDCSAGIEPSRELLESS
jgi:hypothetical protein